MESSRKMDHANSLKQWLLQPEGVSLIDKLKVILVKLLYLSLRVILRTIIGKNKRDRLFINKQISYKNFMFFSVTVFMDGLKVCLRAGQEDLGLMSHLHEPEITKLLKNGIREDSVFVDVGANIGKYVLLASKIIKTENGGKIIAIEPDPDNYRILVKNCKLNGLIDVICVNEAVYDQEGEANLYIPSSGRGRSSLVSQSDKSIKVKTKTLDKILLDELKIHKVDWILIDVEGSEDKVLKGATKILDRTGNIIVETHSDDNTEFITSLLKAKGFDATMVKESYSMPHILGKKILTR